MFFQNQNNRFATYWHLSPRKSRISIFQKNNFRIDDEEAQVQAQAPLQEEEGLQEAPRNFSIFIFQNIFLYKVASQKINSIATFEHLQKRRKKKAAAAGPVKRGSGEALMKALHDKVCLNTTKISF